jgi:hypothetical protein
MPEGADMPIDDQGRSYPDDEAYTSCEWDMEPREGEIFREEDYREERWRGVPIEMTWMSPFGTTTFPSVFTSMEVENAGMRLHVRADVPTWAQVLMMPGQELDGAHIEFDLP